ncbi:MAG: glycosyltransferase family 2 protein [Acetobacter cibinongensis]
MAGPKRPAKARTPWLHRWFGKPAHASRKPLAVFTMVYNEHTMLPVWARYYVRQVGAGNVYVLDHGSDFLPDLPGCTVIHLPRHELDEIERARQVQCFQQKLLENYRFVLFTDCDEMLVARPSCYGSLVDYVQKSSHATIRCVGVDVIQHTPDLPPVDWSKPILMQRPYGAIRPWSCKTLLSAVPLTWVPGFHTAQQTAYLDEDLWMLHLKYADETRLFTRLAMTRTLAWSQQARSLGHGSSHRMADQTMRDFMTSFQNARTEEDLDSLPLREVVRSGQDSRLLRIPHTFLQAL